MNPKKIVICGMLCFTVFIGHIKAQQGSYFSGNGGKGKSLAVLVPDGKGLSGNEAYLPSLAQGEFVTNMKKYSAIDVLDRQNLERVLRETESGIYTSEADFVQLGRIARVGYIMTGSIIRTSSGYALQMQIADTQTGRTAASHSENCTIAEFDNFTGIKRVALVLLTQMGVNLNDRAKTELSGAAAENHVGAQTALARGITAEKRGATIVEVMQYYYQAVDYDSKLTEAIDNLAAVNRKLTTLSQPLTVARTGNIRQDSLNEIAAYRIENENKRIDNENRQVWIKQLTDCENYFSAFFKKANAPLELNYSTVQRVGLDKVNETVTLGFSAVLSPLEKSWFTAAQQTVAALRKGLMDTGRAKDWDLADWPAKTITSTPFTNVRINYAIRTELLDENGAWLGTGEFTLTGGWDCTITSGKEVTFKAFTDLDVKNIVFAPIKVSRIPDTLSIRIRSINGIDAETAAQNGVLAITGDTQKFEQAKKRVISKAKWEDYKANYSVVPPLYFELGYVFEPNYPVGFRIGMFGAYLTMNFHLADWQGYSPNKTNEYYDSYKHRDYAFSNRTTETSTEVIFGYSFNIIDGFAMAPIGLGFRLISEHGLYGNNVWLKNEEGGKFVFETGLVISPVKWVSLLATYRLIGFKKSSFTVGTCFTWFYDKKNKEE